MRYIYLIFLLFIFISCSESSGNKKFKIGFSQCTGNDAWREQMLATMEGELLFHPEIELLYRDAAGDNTKQVNDIRDLVSNEIDLLIVSPNEAIPITPVVEEVFKKGIPVIVVDRKISSNFYTSYIGANNYEIGKLAGQYVSDLLNGKGRILEIWGLRGSTPAIERHRGFVEALTANSEIEIANEINGEWEIDTVKHRLPTIVKDMASIDLVFAHNDVMAYGAYEVFKSYGIEADKKFLGIDGLPGPAGGIQFVSNNILDATFLYPTGGEEAITIANRILHKEPFEKDNILHSIVIDEKNVRVMKLQTEEIIGQQNDIFRLQGKINEQINAYTNQRILIYVLLASLLASIIVGAMAILAWREKNEMNVQLEDKRNKILEQKNKIAEIADRAEHATQEKLKFFTNISHEFKTPLTLILGPIEEMLSPNTFGKQNKLDNLKLIKQNATRLLRLVNQLMDFRKIEDRKMPLRASEGNLVAFIQEVMAAFEKTAHKRKIEYVVNSPWENLPAWFEADKLDKVVFNLLSNAFKFTHDGGRITITLSVDEKENKVAVFIEDNGIGMSQEHMDHAFDRFYSSGTAIGTGLGLSLSKEFVELHHGNLVVSSELGKGTRFCIILPLGKSHLSEEEINWDKVELTMNHEYEASIDDTHFPELKIEYGNDLALKERTILLVDDNADMRFFIRGKLQKMYNVQEAHDGVAGLEKAFEIVPDLIICDIMLPKKNGIEVATHLKNDLRTSHIPIIILTARDSMEHKIEGIKTGADEYITKPFIFDYLNEKIKMLIRNRESLKEHYSHDINAETSVVTPGQLDRKFINDFKAFIEKNISNEGLNVNEIAHEMGMSRVQVYRKVRALLGFSVNDYLVNVRLQKAKFLLANTDKSISEISHEVGFASAAYFSTMFKRKVRISPKEYKMSKMGSGLKG
jgi:signal transduction histidine kinase/DNA-binding response OmpR family regulator